MQIGISLALGNAAADPLALAVRSAFEFGTGSAVDNRNGTAPSFTRATAASVPGFEKLDYAISGEARIGGMRRARNLFATTSEDLSNAAWTKSNVSATYVAGDAPAGCAGYTSLVTSGAGWYCEQIVTMDSTKSFRVSGWIRLPTGTASTGVMFSGLANTGWSTLTGAFKASPPSNAWVRFSGLLTISAGASFYFRLGSYQATSGIDSTTQGTVHVAGLMMEDVTGQSNQNPSEYVSVGALSSPYHGCYVDGVKYFSTENGNTVASNVVTEATGAMISSSTRKGLLVEGARTNNVLYSSGGTTSWTSSATLTPNYTSAAGLSFVRFVQGAPNDYAIPALSGHTDGAVTISAYFKQDGSIAGTFNFVLWDSLHGSAFSAAITVAANGVISAVQTAGTLLECVHVGDGVYRVSGTGTDNFATDGATFYVVVNSAIASVLFGGEQWEAASIPSTYIPTTSAAVTRNKSDMSNATGAWFSATAGAVAIEATTPLSSGTPVLWSVDDGTANERIYIHRNASNEIHCLVVDGGVTQADLNLGVVADSTAFKLALAWSANDIAASLNGGAVVTDATATLPTVTTIHHGEDAAAANQWGGYIKRERYWATRLLNAQLVGLAA